jgi:hypothetical protein
MAWIIDVVLFPIGAFAVLWANVFRSELHYVSKRALKHRDHDESITSAILMHSMKPRRCVRL